LVSYGAFVCARRALNRPFRRFPDRAGAYYISIPSTCYRAILINDFVGDQLHAPCSEVYGAALNTSLYVAPAGLEMKAFEQKHALDNRIAAAGHGTVDGLLDSVDPTALSEDQRKPFETMQDLLDKNPSIRGLELSKLASTLQANVTTAAEQCADAPGFKDELGFACADWVGLDCSAPSDVSDKYSIGTTASLLTNCPLTCGVCVADGPPVDMGTLGVCDTLPGGMGGNTPINLGVMWLKLLEMDEVDPYALLWQMLLVGISLRFVSLGAMLVREKLNMKLADVGNIDDNLEMLDVSTDGRQMLVEINQGTPRTPGTPQTL
jgi:hypothetical protein